MLQVTLGTLTGIKKKISQTGKNRDRSVHVLQCGASTIGHSEFADARSRARFVCFGTLHCQAHDHRSFCVSITQSDCISAAFTRIPGSIGFRLYMNSKNPQKLLSDVVVQLCCNLQNTCGAHRIHREDIAHARWRGTASWIQVEAAVIARNAYSTL